MVKKRRIIISLTEQLNDQLEKLMKDGIYSTKAEAIRDAVRLLLKTNKEESRK